MRAKQLPTTYDPKSVEEKWYTAWEKSRYFHAAANEEVKKDKVYGRTYSIVMPPPNVTGSLHLGHALDNTLQDILIRWRRMQGYHTLWLPGTDHAGIATQARVEEQLAAEGLSKYDLGREKFLERVWEWKAQYGDRITRQLRKLGTSCDWERERFTLDEGCSAAVQEVFVRLYEKGLIYQGNYIINWCPKCQTTISDIEVEHETRSGNLWHISYPVIDGEEAIIVATTRPETMLGDTAVAVHPDDERYRHLIGKRVNLPLMNRPIPVISDEFVDKEFGTGAVKVTPAHDPNDFEIGLRHGLEQVTVIGRQGTMTEQAGKYAGLDRYAARERIVQDLKELGLLVKVEGHEHAVGQCYRCDTVIEPLVSKQWFVKMKPLAEPAIARVLSGETRFVPERFTRIYIHWMENIRDWCISRQLWWGHRIPVWYCEDCSEVVCSRTDPDQCPNCNSANLRQDEDVLDTWFSSALWPFSTLGWPDDTEDMRYFYPTTVLVTGRDIIFFWVARMIFSAIEQTGQVPFYDVNIHGLILDAQGRKMSKSLDNGVDPIEVIEKYGADTLRFSLITGVTPGNDVRFHWEKVENIRNFANKIWNASRFVMMNLDDYETLEIDEKELQLADKWILSRVSERAQQITALLEKYELGEAARVLYDFIWDEFCDWYIELCKPRLSSAAVPAEKLLVQNVLVKVLEDILHLLHPFMPFVSEEIYQSLPGASHTIMLNSWPDGSQGKVWPAAVTDMQRIMAIIRAVRNIRAEFNVPPGSKIKILLVVPQSDLRSMLATHQSYIRTMSGVNELELLDKIDDKPAQAVSALSSWFELYVPLEGLIDVNKEVQRLNKELQNTLAELAKAENKLANQDFLARAPEAVIEKEKGKAEEARNRKEGILQRLEILSK